MHNCQCTRDKLRIGMFGFALNMLSTSGRHPGRTVEYSFALENIGTAKRKLLDVGSSGSIFPLKMARMGFKVTAVDMRPYCKTHPNLKFVRGDLKTLPFLDESFDAVTCISTIEHVGLSAYGDPKYDYGDSLTIDEFRRVLEPGGRLVLTTPYSSKYELLKWKNAYERIYNQEKINTLFARWKRLREEYYVCRRWQDWRRSTEEGATKTHPSYPRCNLSCFVFEKP
jgi:2-polyprenyl-3-methyl-5-hydroxy-6-metoxy-1,4-benzoquinol methylase